MPVYMAVFPVVSNINIFQGIVLKKRKTKVLPPNFCLWEITLCSQYHTITYSVIITLHCTVCH